MRLVTYQRNGLGRSGIVVGADVYDTGFATTRAALEAGSIAPRERVGAVDEVELLAPVTDPDKIICLGLNYRDHAAESGLALPKAPLLFAKFRNSLTGPTAPIVLPSRGELIDYEAELAVVIGRRGKDIAESDALEHIAGAMVFNDVTARDVQHATSQWTAGKAIDTFAPCGPALVTLDEAGDLQDLAIRARVNGVTVQDGHTSQMIFGVAETIAFVSSLMTLEVGDIIATGTPAGVGISRSPQVLLQDGDVVEIEIEGLGTLRNPVAALVAVEA
ncbi:fumarylacetoacetate hydrolase family protein [Solirubrobacter soli]|uniref:fumarylacetoacetate hydrolase family protein n=1 Tax=Solirubrobacter soli TaxID=363832 RepID=UPI0004220079|nr:fumarylacetoacetate hydrolase family protein [Solirubrobacter soli]